MNPLITPYRRYGRLNNASFCRKPYRYHLCGWRRLSLNEVRAWHTTMRNMREWYPYGDGYDLRPAALSYLSRTSWRLCGPVGRGRRRNIRPPSPFDAARLQAFVDAHAAELRELE